MSEPTLEDAPTPQTAAGRAALEQHGKGLDWDAIAAAAIAAQGSDQVAKSADPELATLRVRHRRVILAAHQACDNVLELFAALAQDEHYEPRPPP